MHEPRPPLKHRLDQVLFWERKDKGKYSLEPLGRRDSEVEVFELESLIILLVN